MSDPLEGGRDYRAIADASSLPDASTDATWAAAHGIHDALDENVTTDLDDDLEEAGIDAMGFELKVTPEAGEFGGVSGAVGFSALWITNSGATGNPDQNNPHLHLFAKTGSGGPAGIGDAPDPDDGIEGSLFVARYGGDDSAIAPETWAIANESTGVDAGEEAGGLLNGQVVSYPVPGGAMFFWWYSAVWQVIAADVGISVDGDGAIGADVGGETFQQFEWPLDPLGSESPLDDAEEPAAWLLTQLDLRSPLEDIDGLAEYGDAELYYDVDQRAADVRSLQEDLWELGFWFKGMVDEGARDEYGFETGNQSDRTLVDASGDQSDASGEFDVETEWAVREFQCYAKMETVAAYTGPDDVGSSEPRYVDDLEPVDNDARYEGEIHGYLDEETGSAIQYWLENDWRCPVVVEAYEGADDTVSDAHDAVAADDEQAYTDAIDAGLGLQNFWRRSDPEALENPGLARVFVVDHSEYYAATATDVDVPGFHDDDAPGFVVGQYESALDGGPVSLPRWNQTWADGEIRPGNLLEDVADVDGLVADADALSTFKVVRSVSEVECLGFFDSVNSYDNAVVSVGPCHWTLTLGTEGDRRRNPDQAMDEGELPAYLSYLDRDDEQLHNQAMADGFARFGVGVETDWGDDGGDLFGTGGRKYTGNVNLRYWTSDDDEDYVTESTKNRDRNYFRTWHWFYRWVSAGRTIEGYRSGMWDMARIRIRDLRRTPFPDRPGVPTVQDDGDQRPARLGEVFTSERAMAILLRWHIRAPAHVVAGGDAGAFLHGASYTISFYHGGQTHSVQVNPTGALSFAEQDGADDLQWNDPTNWGDDHEASLVQGLLDSADECATLHQQAYDSVGADNSAFTNVDDTIETTSEWTGWAGWQADTYDLDVDAIADHERGDDDYNPRTLTDLLSADRDSFDFDSDTVGETSPQ